MSLIHDFRKIHAIDDLFSRIKEIPTLKVCHNFFWKSEMRQRIRSMQIFFFFILHHGKLVFCKKLELYLSSDLSLVFS